MSITPCLLKAQKGGPYVKRILEEFGNTAKAYLLSANRPTYSVSAYTTDEKHLNIDAGIVFNNEIYEFPLDISYGVTDNFEIFAGLPPYTQSYNFSGSKIGGVGDFYVGFRYKFQESGYYIHAFQTALKIPVASENTELGTGFVDFHFGLAHAFSYRRFSYELGVEMNLLHRRSFPNIRLDKPPFFREIIDSIKESYNYKYEPEFGISLSPGFDISQKLFIYAGAAFSRNFRLDYNYAQAFSGLGYAASDRVSLNFGTSFGLLKSSGWLISAGVSIYI